MRIGVYGDSFADQYAPTGSWWNSLSIDFGHEVCCFGNAGSSILYSVDLLMSNHHRFDINIWCVTCPGRFSVWIPELDRWFHSTNYMDIQGRAKKDTDDDFADVRNACEGYLKYVFDHRLENITGKALVHYLQHMVPNLLVIPCFYPPLEMPFNLYRLCQLEVNAVLPGRELHEIYQSYRDTRVCHLSSQNNRILAQSVDENLQPGVLQADYAQFDFSRLTLSDLLQPI